MALPRKGRVALGSSAAVSASFLAACSQPAQAPDYAGVCMDQKTQQRLADDRCDDSGGHYHHPGVGWVFFARGRNVPAVGQKMTGYSTAVPKNLTYSKGSYSPTGGKVGADTIKEGTPIKGGANGKGAGSVTKGGFGSGIGGHGG